MIARTEELLPVRSTLHAVSDAMPATECSGNVLLAESVEDHVRREAALNYVVLPQSRGKPFLRDGNASSGNNSFFIREVSATQDAIPILMKSLVRGDRVRKSIA